MVRLRVLLFLACLGLMTGCVANAPGTYLTFVGQKQALKPETMATGPRRVALVNRLPPVLYIHNLEGNVWAGKSRWEESEKLFTTAVQLEEAVAARLRSRFGEIDVRRMSLADAHAARDVDWIILLLPNGLVVPDFSWGEFARIVLVGSAAVAAGTAAPRTLGNMAGTIAEHYAAENRPAYTLGTHALHGTSVALYIRWEIREAGTWRALGRLDAGSHIRLPRDMKDKLWEQWTAEDQAMIWQALDNNIAGVTNEQLDKLGL